MASTGFLHYLDYLNIDRESYLLHYDFNTNSGSFVRNSATFPQLSGYVPITNGFYNITGSGNFTGHLIQIQNSSGLPHISWTHFIVFNKINNSPGVLFDSLRSGNPYFSGFVLGINANNKLYFETYYPNGPKLVTSNLMLGRQNCVAISKNENLLNFYCYDFNNEELLSDSFEIEGQYILKSNKGIIGKTSGAPGYVTEPPFSGYIDEYVILSEAVNPSHLGILFSGFVSHPQSTSGSITNIQITGVTGFSMVFTGITGITGTINIATGSGYDSFGDLVYLYLSSGLTGFIVQGSGQIPITGIMTYSITGDPTDGIIFNSGFKESFKLDEISYTLSFDSQDITTSFLFRYDQKNINKRADFDFVKGEFELDEVYATSQVNLYLNGVGQFYNGFSVTGNFYGSGYVITEDYFLDDFLVKTTGFYNSRDTVIYDIFTGTHAGIVPTGLYSGTTETATLLPNFIFFLNGQLLTSGYHYIINGNNTFQWFTNDFSGAGGKLFVFQIQPEKTIYTGISAPTGVNFPRKGSMVYLNGVRQVMGNHYLENSTLDLIGQSGIFQFRSTLIYNGETGYFE